MQIVVAVFTDPTWSIPREQVDRLRRSFPHHTFTDARSERELVDALAEAEVAFTGLVGGAMLARAPRLRWVQSPAAGVGRLLSPQMLARDVVITNSRGIVGVPIAEHVLGVATMFARRLHLAVRNQVAHRWAKPTMSEVFTLAGRVMGIVGFGAVGSAIGRLASSAGMRVSALRRNPGGTRAEFLDAVYGPGQLHELLALADFVVLAAPLTPATTGLIGSAEIRRMKPTAFLINVARGKLIRQEELARELTEGTIAGAALDVFEHEPLDRASPLWDLANVIITPHTSAFFADYWQLAVDLFAQNLHRFENGEPLVNVVDKEAGY
jgi:phosphoglycerate dehydrogenase-like enzyme